MKLAVTMAAICAAISILSGCTTAKKVNNRSAMIPAYEDAGKGLGQALKEEAGSAKWLWK